MCAKSAKNTRKYKKALASPTNRLLTAIFSENTSQTIRLIKEYPEIKTFTVFSLLIDAKNDSPVHEYTEMMLKYLVDKDFNWTELKQSINDSGYIDMRELELLKILHSILESEEVKQKLESMMWIWHMC